MESINALITLGKSQIEKWHFHDALSKTGVDAVAAANVFHYVDQSVYLSKKYLYEKKLNIRKPDLIEI